jgi:hypothetical protein
MGCKVLERMVLKGVFDEVGKLENATRKRSIRIIAKSRY